jgi:HAD superfamily hydrolase (TIGR01490 family)
LALKVAFFDLDKTLVRVNTGQLYARWRFQRGESGVFDIARAAFWSFQYTLGWVDADFVSRSAAQLVRGRFEHEFETELRDWYEAMVREHVTDAARAEVKRKRADGFVPVILTGSSPYVARPVAEDFDIEHFISSRLAIHDGRFTGEIEAPLCYGEGKRTLAREWASARGVDLRASAFYTDSLSDLPMLEEVGEPRVVNPDPRLYALAKKRGWPIEIWR